MKTEPSVRLEKNKQNTHFPTEGSLLPSVMWCGRRNHVGAGYRLPRQHVSEEHENKKRNPQSN